MGVFLTAYYTFRLIFIILFPRPSADASKSAREPATEEGKAVQQKIPEEPGHEGGRSYWAMAGPILVLAALALLLGLIDKPLGQFLSGGKAAPAGEHSWLAYVGGGAGIAAIVVAWLEFGRRGSPQVGFVERIPALRDFFAERWYLDRIYGAFVRSVIDGVFSRTCARGEDEVINESIDKFSHFTLDGGHLLSLLQSGKVRYNLAFPFAVIVIVALYFLFV